MGKLSDNPPKRIAVIFPQNRGWSWHLKIISILKKSYDVDVYAHPLAPQYPLWLRVWMQLERWILGKFDLAKLVVISGAPWGSVNNIPYSMLINLSELPISESKVPILVPRFGDQTDSLSLIATLLARNAPLLAMHLVGRQEPVVASYLAIQDKTALLRGLQFSFARLVVLTERAINYVDQGLQAAILPKTAAGFPTYSDRQLAFFATRFFYYKVSSRIGRLLRHQEHWSIALLWTDHWRIPDGVPFEEFQILPDDGHRLYADPFLLTDSNRTWLFVEELNYQTGKGVISCAEVSEGAVIQQLRPVLERGYHLSYPFIFRDQENIYMIPETGGNRTVELYRARAFPSEWEFCRALIENIQLYDSTLLWYENRWWLFAAAAHELGSDQDELVIFHSETLNGPWQPHPLNPVKSDCRSARPAGRIVVDGERLLRPAQDCERGYGTGLVWLEIIELTSNRFSEREVTRWKGTALHADGIHTFNCDGKLGVVDIRRRVWKKTCECSYKVNEKFPDEAGQGLAVKSLADDGHRTKT